MRVHWTDRAKARLRYIEEDIAQDNPKAAKKIIEGLLRRSWLLAEPPDIGRRLKNYENAGLKEVLVRPYRIIYRMKATQVDVITVLHYRQLLPKDLHRG